MHRVLATLSSCVIWALASAASPATAGKVLDVYDSTLDGNFLLKGEHVPGGNKIGLVVYPLLFDCNEAEKARIKKAGDVPDDEVNKAVAGHIVSEGDCVWSKLSDKAKTRPFLSGVEVHLFSQKSGETLYSKKID